MTQTSGRLLKLLSLLQARREWPGHELAGRLEVSGRTVRRDIDRLRELGYPVDAMTGPAGGYRLEAGTAMPPLLLEDDEAVAIAVGLRTSAGASVTGIEETSIRALVKLEQVLPTHLRRQVAALNEATVTLGTSGPTVDPACLTAIAAAARDRECLRFDYSTREGERSQRHVEPNSLVNLGRRWYFVAWDIDRDDWRTFRVDRISNPRRAARRFDPRELPGGVDAAAWVQRNLKTAPQPYEARVILHASAAAVGERFPWTKDMLTPIDDERCEYRMGDVSLDYLAVRIGMIGYDFDVREPPELVERFQVLSERFARATQRPPASARRPRSGRSREERPTEIR